MYVCVYVYIHIFVYEALYYGTYTLDRQTLKLRRRPQQGELCDELVMSKMRPASSAS